MTLHKTYVANVFIPCFVAITVMFSQSLYSANEDAGSIQIEIVLSAESSANIAVEVYSTNRSATGTHCNVWLTVNTN